MGWRFRKSFTVIPGVRLNVSRRGVSATLGAGPVSVHVGPTGTYVNAHVPGTGIGYRQRVSAGSPPAARGGGRLSPAHAGPADLPPDAPAPDGVSPEFRRALAAVRVAHDTEAARLASQARSREIRSASTAALTSPHLAEFRDALTVALRERDTLTREIATARPAAQAVIARHRAWEAGWFVRRVRRKRFEALAAEAATAKDHLAELEEQLRLSVMPAEFTLPPEEADAYGAVLDAFAILREAAVIWDTTHTAATDRVRERTAASSTIERKRVTFDLRPADVLASAWRVPRLENANGGDLYLYPGIVLYRIARDAFAVLEAPDVAVGFEPQRFIEREAVPRDSTVVGRTWEYVNKNGSPDRRFAHNPEIPIAQYGKLSIRSVSGLREDYLVSAAATAQAFATAWARYTGA